MTSSATSRTFRNHPLRDTSRGARSLIAGTMRSIRHAIIAALLVLVTVPAIAQSNYPNRNIRLIFGGLPGTDTFVRLVADKLAEAFGKPVIIENVAGAAGNIAADRIARAAPDGYTIGVLLTLIL